jgi:phage shock protein PspC (stress-responsive transcriptional regulator)
MTCGRCAREIEAESAYCRFCGTRIAPSSERHLVRLPEAGRLAGVCAGIAAYFDSDVTLVRLLWVILSVFPGALIGGAIAYAAAWVLMKPSHVAPPAIAVTRLVRPRGERKIGGVCAGLAQFTDLDVTLVRLLWVVLSIYPGAVIGGVIVYAIAWLVMPSEDERSFTAAASHA